MCSGKYFREIKDVKKQISVRNKITLITPKKLFVNLLETEEKLCTSCNETGTSQISAQNKTFKLWFGKVKGIKARKNPWNSVWI